MNHSDDTATRSPASKDADADLQSSAGTPEGASPSAEHADPIWRRVLFEENFQPAWIYDLQTLAILEVNAAAIKLYGYSREQFLSMTLKDIRPPEDIPALLDRVANFEFGRQVSGEWRHLCSDGTLLYAEVASYEMDFAGRRSRLAVINDVTERHLAEEAPQENHPGLSRIV